MLPKLHDEPKAASISYIETLCSVVLIPVWLAHHRMKRIASCRLPQTSESLGPALGTRGLLDKAPE